ncbi:DMT family transporter [Aliidiomarina shirensis]|uniref:DMT family transporter n=1 Tax=Aliidiomarina shirensis TaxID=1048642 RepID=UPI001F541F9C|nr:DMT family transporter [Aliidiomarina shirensis]
MNNLIAPLFLGQLAALTAAFCWALATLMYSRSSHHLSSAQLNLVKGMIASPLLLIGLWLFADLELLQWQSTPFILLLLSGVIGITVGDTCYFSALRRLGPAHTILFEYLAPPFAALIAWLVLSESMSIVEIGAALVVIIGVLLVLTERQPVAGVALSRSGLLFAVAAALCQAIGLVMAFYAFQNFDVNALQAAMLRLSAGTAALTVALLLLKPRMLIQTWSAVQKTKKSVLLTAIILGTFLAIWLQQIAIAYVTPGIAQTLLSTAPLFMLGLNLFRGRTVSFRALLGTFVAMIGIGLLFLR